MPRSRVPQPPPGNPGTGQPGNPTPKSADDWYNEALVAFSNRDFRATHEALVRAVEADPTHSKAHFRLGQMAIIGRHFGAARGELSAALRHPEKLTEREVLLCQIGLAICDGNRPRARALAEELRKISPNDPDLFRFMQAFSDGRQGQGQGPGQQQPPRRRPFRNEPLR